MQSQSRDTLLHNTHSRRPLSRPVVLSAAGLATLSLLAITIPSVPATAASRNEFQVCANQLLSVGVAPESASVGCAEALYPKDLSSCVFKIKQQTAIAAQAALDSCGRVRRPTELATCVVDISKRIPDVVAPDVMDYCRRSLLPVRFSQCVVGFNIEMDFSAPKAMQTCIDARDWPGQVPPAFVPSPVTPAPAPVNPGTQS